MIIDFYESVRNAWRRNENRPNTLTVAQAKEIVSSFSKDEQAKLAYHLNKWEWETDLLGEFTDYKKGWEYAHIFTAFISKYEVFKYKCKVVDKLTDEEFKEAVIAAIFDKLF